MPLVQTRKRGKKNKTKNKGRRKDKLNKINRKKPNPELDLEAKLLQVRTEWRLFFVMVRNQRRRTSQTIGNKVSGAKT